MAALRLGLVCFAASLLLPAWIALAQAEPAPVDSIKDLVARLRTCWKPPPASRANPGIDITVVVSFNRDGAILGRPKITYESEQATDNDRLNYRIAVMEALQRCTPMPFTEGMAGAVAGRPFAVQFHNRKIPPQPAEKRAWLIPKIL
jgi:allophanate hydrolase subunit 1